MEMILLNFSHLLTAARCVRLEDLDGGLKVVPRLKMRHSASKSLGKRQSLEDLFSWNGLIRRVRCVRLQQQHVQLLHSGQMPIIGDKQGGAALQSRSDLQRIGDVEVVRSPQSDSRARQGRCDRQQGELGRVEQQLLVGVNEVLPSQALGLDADFDERDDRGDALHLGLS